MKGEAGQLVAERGETCQEVLMRRGRKAREAESVAPAELEKGSLPMAQPFPSTNSAHGPSSHCRRCVPRTCPTKMGGQCEVRRQYLSPGIC